MFRVKICGVTNVEDAITAVETGADAIGLNFYEKSPRFVSNQKAKQIAGGISRWGEIPVNFVGVFVNHTFTYVKEFWQRAGPRSTVQLHGDDSPEHVARVKAARGEWTEPTWLQVIWARRLDGEGLPRLAKGLDACARAGARPDALLVDAALPGVYGGTGRVVDWSALADHHAVLGETPLILAGGLTPDNVAEAIRIVRPAAVDVASGVESSPGKKDPVKMRDFVANALGAFEALRL